MREWFHRRKIFCAAAVILLLIVYLWPISLGSRIPASEPLVITWVEMSVTPPLEGEVTSTLNNEATTYRLESGTEERTEFQALMEGCTIHRTWRTPFPANSLGDSNGAFLHISWENGDDVVLFVTGFTGPILLDDHIYRLGYLNQHLSLDMQDRVSAFLSHCTPVSANES